MCLLGIVPKKADRQETTTAWLRDVYERNPDGFGFMWSTPNGGVHVYKSIGKFREFKRAWREMERHSGEFAFHLRMKTHGLITKEMAHPYPIGDTGMHLMHNGVLACGNASDRDKSDTWHYINDMILPLYTACGMGIFSEQLLDMMGDAIGNNRFVMIDTKGELHVVNKHQGVKWNGMWLSNTYAWSASKFGYYSGKAKKSLLDDDTDFDWGNWRTWQAGGKESTTRDYSTPGRSLVPTNDRKKAYVGTLLDKDGKPAKVAADVVDIFDPTANQTGNPSYDFVQLLYTLGYTEAANALSMNDVDDYTQTFGLEALERFAIEVAEFQLEDDEIIAEILMEEVGEEEADEEEEEAAADRAARIAARRASIHSQVKAKEDNGIDGFPHQQMQLEDLGDRAALAAESARATVG